MTEAVYAVLYSGEHIAGFEPAQVEAGMASALGLEVEGLRRLTQRLPAILRHGLSLAEAERCRDLLREAGAVVSIVQRAGEVPPAPVPAAASEAPPAANPPVVENLPPKDDAEPQVLPFRFQGVGGEFFRIWIVNVLLSIVTLGIYSAWAKVRTMRYFYGNTSLDGSSFEYMATPMQILKGRLIAIVFFLIYTIVGNALPLVGIAMALLLMLAMPWIIVRALAFRNRHSAWRGVRFGFTGKVGGAVVAFLLWPLAGILTLGLLMPLALQRQQRFLIGHSRYGTTDFDFTAGAVPFYKLFLWLILIVLAGGALSGMVVWAGVAPLSAIVMALTYLLLFAAFNTGYTNLVYGNSVLGEHRFVSRYELKSYVWLMLGNLLGMVLTLGLFYPWAKVRTARYAADHIAVQVAGSLDGFVAAQQDGVTATGGEMADLFDIEIGL
jgi:uncharacterized membrane protein YjgN (DUF898 family)